MGDLREGATVELDDAQKQDGACRWDGLALELQALRERAGDPSYEKIATRVANARQAQGASEHAARVARTTIYDAFRTGRPRANLDLSREIALVLGATNREVDQWVAQCLGQSGEADEEVEIPLRNVLLLMGGCLALNMVGRLVVDFLSLPIYLDMLGTAFAAVALGPWRGAMVGASTNLLAAATSGWVSIPFAIVNVAGALVWGYGVRRFGYGRTLPRYFLLNLYVALTCSLLAVPILVLVFGGSVGQGQDTITQTFIDLGNGLLVAVGFSNLLTSTADKLLSGFIALVGCSTLPPAMRRDLPLVLVEQRQ